MAVQTLSLPEARAHIRMWAAEDGIAYDALVSPLRSVQVVRTRTRIAKRLWHVHEMSFKEIGLLLRRDRTTIMHHLGKEDIDYGFSSSALLAPLADSRTQRGSYTDGYMLFVPPEQRVPSGVR